VVCSETPVPEWTAEKKMHRGSDICGDVLKMPDLNGHNK
jgi:hypothetical protein